MQRGDGNGIPADFVPPPPTTVGTIRHVQSAMSKLTKLAVLAAASTNPTRAVLNRRYNRKALTERTAYHAEYAKIFRRFRLPVQPGDWRVDFNGTPLRIPIRRETAWLDWDVALSIVAHDPEIKQFYRAVVNGPARPDVFVDVGANYGTHSVLMASQGIETIAFEPLSRCIGYGRGLARANGLDVRWVHAAVGEEPGTVTLRFPERATWLATAKSAEVDDDGEGFVSETAEVVRLDTIAETVRGKRILMKIDVEGYEVEVLKGAADLLAGDVTLVLESNPGSDRAALYRVLRDHRLVLRDLTAPESPPLDAEAFAATRSINFVADRLTSISSKG